jgi:delta 1-pyrroline-5-carboxylate dehydrogenase
LCLYLLHLTHPQLNSWISEHIKASSGAYKYFCNGQWLESSSGKTVPVTNPSTLQKDYQVQACTQEEVNSVFAAAKAAQLSWAKTPLWKRAEYLHKVAVLMRQNAQPMADCLVKEIAKPAKDALTGAPAAQQQQQQQQWTAADCVSCRRGVCHHISSTAAAAAGNES